MVYQDSIESGITPADNSCQADCPDNYYRRHLSKKAMLYLLRGVAAALLMPIDALEHLRRGRRTDRRTWISWLLSAAIWASGLTTWILARATYFDGRDRTSLILVYGLAWLGTAVISGGFESRASSAMPARRELHGEVLYDLRHGDHGHHGHDHGHDGHHGHHEHHEHPHGKPFPFRSAVSPGAVDSETISPTQQPAGSASCSGDCRNCTADICVKSGRPKRRESK